MQILAESPDLVLGAVQWPPGTMISDQFLGTQEVYLQQVDAEVTLTRQDYGAHPVQVKVVYQGCAKAGLCYPTIAKVLFPEGEAAPPTVSQRAPLRWEWLAMLGGCGAFLLAGLRLRKRRTAQATAP
jgi:thiol:disulfide interchange protein